MRVIGMAVGARAQAPPHRRRLDAHRRRRHYPPRFAEAQPMPDMGP